MGIRFVLIVVGSGALLAACKRDAAPRAEATPMPTVTVVAAKGADPWQEQQQQIRENTRVEIKAACRRPAIAEPGDWVAIDADFVKLPGVRLDPDDFVTLGDSGAWKAVGNAAFPIALAEDGTRGSWEDPEVVENRRLRVLFLFSGVPASVTRVRLGYGDAVLGEATAVEASCPKRIHDVIAAEFAQQ